MSTIHYFSLFYVLFLPFLSYGEESVTFLVKAKMVSLNHFSLECTKIDFNNIFKISKPQIVCKKAITLKINYNRFKQIKVALMPKEINSEKLLVYAFESVDSGNKSMVPYTLFFNKTNLPVPENGEIFTMNSNYHNPLINYCVILDICIRREDLRNISAGNYQSGLILTITELE